MHTCSRLYIDCRLRLNSIPNHRVVLTELENLLYCNSDISFVDKLESWWNIVRTELTSQLIIAYEIHIILLKPKHFEVRFVVGVIANNQVIMFENRDSPGKQILSQTVDCLFWF